MGLIEAIPPPGRLYHIGRHPDPLAWPEWAYVGGSRFDDPDPNPSYRVLYTAEQRLGAFLETLQKWRPSMEALAALESVTPGPGGQDAPNQEAGVIPADWHLNRRIGIVRVFPDQRWLDLREHETREELRTRLAAKLLEFGQDDFDLGDAFGRDRRVSQAVSQFAHDNEFQGIAYTSRFDDNFDCWAIFEGAKFEGIDRVPIARDDPDLLEAARRFGLRA
jgi:hypothetical protein